jgi:ParB family chromosome partitioning protein
MNMAGPDKRRSLGRGLSALIPQKPMELSSSTAAAPPATGRGLAKLRIDQVLPSDGQPRQVFEETALEELAQSIKTHGVLQPIVVRRRGPDQYEIVAGERRWRASQRAGLTEIEAVITDIAPEETLTVALVENLQRRDLNPIEEAEAYQRLHKEMGYSQAEIATAVGKDRTSVTNALRLLKLPLSVRDLVLSDTISMGHARALLGLDDNAAIEKSAKEVAEGGLSVRQTEALVARARQPAEDAAKPAKKEKKEHEETPAERDVRMRLQRALGTRVELRHKNGVGSVVVHFSGFDALDALLSRMGA